MELSLRVLSYNLDYVVAYEIDIHIFLNSQI